MKEVKATTCTLGFLFPNTSGWEKLGSKRARKWEPIIQKEKAYPARQIVSFDVEPTDGSKRIALGEGRDPSREAYSTEI